MTTPTSRVTKIDGRYMISHLSYINPLKTKRRLLCLKTQFVLRS